jgi:hypothetical protein
MTVADATQAALSACNCHTHRSARLCPIHTQADYDAQPSAATDARVLRYEVPVDDEWHFHDLSGAILHVAARQPDVVEFWAYSSGGPTLTRAFTVFGTGHPLPEWATPDRHRGSVITAGGALVWHLFEATTG